MTMKSTQQTVAAVVLKTSATLSGPVQAGPITPNFGGTVTQTRCPQRGAVRRSFVQGRSLFVQSRSYFVLRQQRRDPDGFVRTPAVRRDGDDAQT